MTTTSTSGEWLCPSCGRSVKGGQGGPWTLSFSLPCRGFQATAQKHLLSRFRRAVPLLRQVGLWSHQRCRLRPTGTWSFTGGGVDTVWGGKPGREVPTGARASLKAVLRCQDHVGSCVGCLVFSNFPTRRACWGPEQKSGLSYGCGFGGVGKALRPCSPQASLHSVQWLLWPLTPFQISWGACCRFPLTQWLSAIPSKTPCPPWSRCLAPQP